MKVSYGRSLLESSKTKKLKLVTVDYNGRGINAGRVTLQCLATPEICEAAENLINVICEQRGGSR